MNVSAIRPASLRHQEAIHDTFQDRDPPATLRLRLHLLEALRCRVETTLQLQYRSRSNPSTVVYFSCLTFQHLGYTVTGWDRGTVVGVGMGLVLSAPSSGSGFLSREPRLCRRISTNPSVGAQRRGRLMHACTTLCGRFRLVSSSSQLQPACGRPNTRDLSIQSAWKVRCADRMIRCQDRSSLNPAFASTPGNCICPSWNSNLHHPRCMRLGTTLVNTVTRQALPIIAQALGPSLS